ncbi:MAG: O-antigen polymerase [Clostridiaceae bacterium]|jgi:O-antigen ligase|nr:O-antigen polymerase [Clostridiaceae bacterium]
MKAFKNIAVFGGIFVSGILSSYLGLMPTVAVITLVVGLVIIFTDYEKATLIAALYTAFEFVLRSVIGRPGSQILSMFGKRVYFDFIQKAIESPTAFSSYWDELALLFCFGVWFYKWVIHRKERPYRETPLDFSILLFMTVGVVLLFVAAPDFSIGVEGLRAVIQYILWFFVVVQLLKTPKGVKRLLNVLLISGLLVSLYGIYQYILAVQIPSSWTDIAEGEVRTRVFSIFTRPNMLAGYLSLLIPVAVGMYFAEKERKRKIYVASAIGAMSLCLLFTMSRGGWIFCFLALIIFVFLKNRKLVAPVIVAMAAVFMFTVVFVPSISNRILYLLSSDYIESSSVGGRVYRTITGYRLFMENFWLGMGHGQFGGSVALNHKLNNTFSMDNYYMKTAVEMGIFGLTAFLMLMYSTIAWCLRALSRIKDNAQKDWTRGIIAGLSAIIMFNLSENMFEIPLISTYFWLLAGVVMFLAYGKPQIEREKNSDENPVTVSAETE